MTDQLKAELSKKVNSQREVDLLAWHDMFKLLSGNPTSITRIAKNFKNEMFCLSLSEIYQRIKHQEHVFVEFLQIN